MKTNTRELKKLQSKLEILKQLKLELKDIQKREMALRVELAESLTNDLPIGKHKFEFEGFDIKVGKNTTLSIDKEMLTLMYEDFTEEEKACIKYSPSLIEGAYNKLDDVERAVLDECVIRKPAAPTIEFIETL